MNSEEDSKHKVLIVDNLEIYRTAFSKLLEKYGYSVASADCSFKAIEVLTFFTPSVVVLACNLPGMNGFECSQNILKIIPEAKVIFTSSDSSLEMKSKAFNSGGYDFLEKPFDGETLKKSIEKCLSNKKPENL